MNSHQRKIYPGCLAFITSTCKETPENLGRIVRVVRRCTEDKVQFKTLDGTLLHVIQPVGDPIWWIESDSILYSWVPSMHENLPTQARPFAESGLFLIEGDKEPTNVEFEASIPTLD